LKEAVPWIEIDATRESWGVILEHVNSNERHGARLVRLEKMGIIRRSRTARPIEALETIALPKSKNSVLTALLEERGTAR
jgi:hypothetical protein